MTADDAFEARLKAAFAAAEPKDGEAFSDRLMARVRFPDRRRTLILGAAGVAGSAIAATQLKDFYAQVIRGLSGPMGEIDHSGVLLALLRPEALAAMTVALMLAALAFLLPSRG
jgi:hypothetical protein